jgi:hypothetical protein
MTPHGIFDNTQSMQRESWQCGVLIGIASRQTFAARPSCERFDAADAATVAKRAEWLEAQE